MSFAYGREKSLPLVYLRIDYANCKSAEFVPNVSPEAYRFFQAADLICSVELVAAKIAEGKMSVSESRFFGDRREFLRNTLKSVRRKSV